MKKILHLLLFMLIVSATANAQTNWITKNLDEKVSVKFPLEPKKTTVNGVDTYAIKGADSVGYVGAMLDFAVVANLDEATVSSFKDNPQFAEQFKTGFASSRPEYTVGDVTIGKWKDYTMYTMTGTHNTNKSTMYVQTVIVGTKMYMQSCIVPAGLVTKDKDQFFASLEQK